MAYCSDECRRMVVQKMVEIRNIGKCQHCGNGTTSGAYKLCKNCSIKLNKCQLCGKSIPPPDDLDAAA